MNRKYIRKYPRVQIRFPVMCRFGETEFRGQASMVGGGGLFLESTLSFPLDSEIIVHFRPAKHLPLIRAKARVCYQVEGRGMALEFTQIDDNLRGTLLRWIHHRTGNRREFPRVRLATQVTLEDSMMLTFSRDVSMGGMFIETREPLSTGSRLSLRFNLDNQGPAVVAMAVVTYQVEKLGMGIQFVDMSPEDRLRIESYVTANLPKPPAKRRVRAAF